MCIVSRVCPLRHRICLDPNRCRTFFSMATSPYRSHPLTAPRRGWRRFFPTSLQAMRDQRPEDDAAMAFFAIPGACRCRAGHIERNTMKEDVPRSQTMAVPAVSSRHGGAAAPRLNTSARCSRSAASGAPAWPSTVGGCPCGCSCRSRARAVRALPSCRPGAAASPPARSGIRRSRARA